MSSPRGEERPPFHLAMPVSDIAAARTFYGEVLGCPEGRSAERWVDFDLFGHQFVVHLREGYEPVESTTGVDGEAVPCPHFGVVLDRDQWDALADRLRAHGVDFVIPPTVRFEGQPGEQATMFFRDPSGNALEFKSMRDPNALFATD